MSCSRRDFLKASGLAGAGFWIGTRCASAKPVLTNEKLNIAGIGVGDHVTAGYRVPASRRGILTVGQPVKLRVMNVHLFLSALRSATNGAIDRDLKR